MPRAFILLLLIAGLPLVIPVAILLGHRRRHGPMIVTAGIAMGIFAIFWVVLGGVSVFFAGADTQDAEVIIAGLFAGFLLTMASWTLALAAAAGVRRYRWVTLLVVTAYLNFVAVVLSVTMPDPCLFGAYSPVVCPNGPNPLAQLLALVGYLLAPASVLAYAFLADRVPGLLPDGLLASPVTLEAEETPDANEFEMHVEHME